MSIHETTIREESNLSGTPNDVRLFPRHPALKTNLPSPSLPIQMRRSASQLALDEVEAAAEERANAMLKRIHSARRSKSEIAAAGDSMARFRMPPPPPNDLQHLLFPHRYALNEPTYVVSYKATCGKENDFGHILPQVTLEEHESGVTTPTSEDLQFNMDL